MRRPVVFFSPSTLQLPSAPSDGFQINEVIAASISCVLEQLL